MTARKPPGMRFPDWVEHQILAAEAAGAFDDLPGAGRPIPGIDRTPDELAWVANYLRRQNADVTGLLPPALALAKEVEDLQVRLLGVRTEAAARAVVVGLNDRIDKAYAAPQIGPPVRVRRVDVDAAIAQWQVTRDEIANRRSDGANVDSEPTRDPRRARRRWRRPRISR